MRSAVNLGRRAFLNRFGKVALGSTAGLLFGDLPLAHAQSPGASQDTATQIFTAALIAEDLATTFYYNGLIGAVIQDPSLAGPAGTALSNTGNVANVTYLRAALGQEITHAGLLRNFAQVATGDLLNSLLDPYQTFYFPANTFSSLSVFISTLETLESAFIGAYLNAIREFSTLAAQATLHNVPTGRSTDPHLGPGGPYSGAQLRYFAEVAASILGVECEHRVLGSVIRNANQPNNWNFEQTDNLTSVYNGSASAVGLLTPFLTPSNGQPYSLLAAVSASALVVPSTGNPPSQ